MLLVGHIIHKNEIDKRNSDTGEESGKVSVREERLSDKEVGEREGNVKDSMREKFRE